MEKSFGLMFILRKIKSRKGGIDSDTYLKITVNGRAFEISTKLKVDIARWNIVSYRVNGQTDYAKSINSNLEVIQRKVYEHRKRLIDDDKVVNTENLKTLLKLMIQWQ